jgi:predicted membrane protein
LAKGIRVGLEWKGYALGGKLNFMNFQLNFTTQSSTREARRFGFIFGVAMLFWGWLFSKHHPAGAQNFFTAGYIFLLLAATVPVILKPVHKIFTIVGGAVGILFTGVILTGLFYIVVTPIAIIAKLSGKKFMNTKFKQPEKKSYWNNHEVIDVDRDSYRKQY